MLDLLYGKFQSDNKFRIDLSTKEKDPQFRYNRERTLPIAKIFGHRGFFLFPTENSYDRFKQTGFSLPNLDPEGVGVPLLQIKTCLTLTGGYTGHSPVYIIFKYIILDSMEPPPFANFEIVKSSKSLVLYKAPYCEVYRRTGLRNIEFKLVFEVDGVQTKHLSMIRRTYNRDLYTVLNETNLRWHVSCSPIDVDHYKLEIMNENAPSLLDDSDTRKLKKKSGTKNKCERIIAHYTRRKRDLLPKTISKESNLIVGEWTDNSGYGISAIPWDTQALACQALLVHYLEYERREDQRKNTNSNNQV